MLEGRLSCVAMETWGIVCIRSYSVDKEKRGEQKQRTYLGEQ